MAFSSSRRVPAASAPADTLAIAPIPLRWGAADPAERGPVVPLASSAQTVLPNAVGRYPSSYNLYAALLNLTGATVPQPARGTVTLGPYPSWSGTHCPVSLDPFGAMVACYEPWQQQGVILQPTIALTRTRLRLPELQNALIQGWLDADGLVLDDGGGLSAVRVEITPVWYLPGVAERLRVDEADLRQVLHEQTGGLFPELVNRRDLTVFLPPVGGATVYLVGAAIAAIEQQTAVYIYRSCGQDTLVGHGCACRDEFAYALETCIETAQSGGQGILIHLHASPGLGGCGAAESCWPTPLLPDLLHWLGVRRIHKFISMSLTQIGAIAKAGIDIVEQVPLPGPNIDTDLPHWLSSSLS